ncbi:Sporulation-specific N-acetylmuramoyl-L-alanine amidase [Oceanobacillus oncorhynchi]|uniref:Sporulation-specific N-acetylmuramoyl-L-alanine amidase n=1 Tax=Oceanobacillus oncorhynchi TaxID=545501 RepID=A0A0A1M6F0_9BACI|nr:peptidoglycan-binding protein [Oceanobacillus oncorhynchi]CEI80840.1 Sporulation-specific N-acetylmuramoyl-L-alanine amidase [Oceanobacillus oncorhynchi]
MRKKWIPFLLIILLIVSPFSSVSEVYAMDNKQSESSEENSENVEDNKTGAEQDVLIDELESEELIFQLGDEDEIIQELKGNLTELGFATLDNPTNYFGLHTKKSVIAFQEFYNLEDTGIADEDTLEKIEDILSEGSFERDEHLEFSKPEEFEMEKEETEEGTEAEGEESPEAEEGTEAEGEESPEAEEGTEAEGEESPEAEEGTEAEGEESPEAEEGMEAEGEESPEAEEGTEAEGEESPEAEEGTEAEGEESPEAEEGTEAEGEESPEAEEGMEAEGEESPEAEEGTEAEGEESPEAEEGTEAEGEESPEAEEGMEAEGEESPEAEEGTEAEGEESPEAEEGMEAEGEESPEAEEGTEAEGEDNSEADNTKDVQVQLFSTQSSNLQKGTSSEQAKKLKEDLKSLGYLTLPNPNNYYGVQTENAVKAFQKDNGLEQSGIADRKTLDQIKKQLNRVPQKGTRTGEVKTLKENLNRLGFTSFPNPNNYFGVQTEKGVREFQKQFGLTVNGMADQATLAKIEEVLNSPLQSGKSNASSKELKENLKSLGYLNLANPNNFYGVQTANAVKAFQKDNGLAQSGIADEVTLDKIKTEVNKVPQKGTSTEEVKNLKEDLNRLGFTSFPNPNNYFGVQTERGVQNFQRQFGLTVNGIADQATLAKIEEVLNSSLQSGKSNASSKQLKENLKRLGYLNLPNPNNFYGVQTANAVKAFQKDNGLAQSGIADEITLIKIDQEVKKLTNVKIFLDPGHGAHDPGGQGYGLNEKDVVLDIALETERILTSKYQGVEVEMSRRSDVFVELTERANHANRWGADYFVSFHNNAFNGSTGGFESYIYNGGVSQETRNRQNDIHSYISSRLNVSDRGQKSANFNVLRNTDMPAILIEYLFIDNFTENALLKSDSYKKQLAQYTADAIAQSYNLKRR